MTIGEVIRHIESFNRVKTAEAKERASYDYILASLVVKGVSITLGSKSTFPSIQEAYPGLFDDLTETQEEAIAEKKQELSILRFKEFARSYNKNFKNKEVLQDSE